MDTVLFDGDCLLCRTLAAYADRRVDGSMRFISWQKYYGGGGEASGPKMFKNEAVELRVIKSGAQSVSTEDESLDGVAAWAYLLEKFPDLSALNWLAGRLNLRVSTALALGKAGSVARRFCRRCGRSQQLR